jgi:hypothetical protein
MSLWGFEEYVIVPFGIERRIKIDKVNRLVRDMLPKYMEVIPKEELIGHKAKIQQYGQYPLFFMVSFLFTL